ncbi:DUF2000 domain-containing protein [Patescibacteria group bacterium]|nr:DUF2000 domain-containing protein [Patescibacteria group bacterium]MBU4367581.1 DUF2000 domain-containing protein [Patescibacteria group bacterium]MBU4461621.1 DUF2000 domain-containing protein [Patescibacteria group bacterium]
MEKYPQKLVAVLNGNIGLGIVMNALAHMALGLGASAENKTGLRFVDYADGDSNSHANISELPFIILRTKNPEELKGLRKELISKNVRFVDFPDFINSIGTFESPEKSRQFKEESIEYYGIVMFGDWDVVSELTRKFSLWR